MGKDNEPFFTDNFDPGPIRKLLGLEGDSVIGMPKFEFLRLANLLFHTGNLSDEDIKKLGMVRRPVSEETKRGWKVK